MFDTSRLIRDANYVAYLLGHDALAGQRLASLVAAGCPS